MSSYQSPVSVAVEHITEDDYIALSQSSTHSQFTFEQDADSDLNYENDSEYLPSSEDESSQEFSQVQIYK